jgi:hypothetical protein
MPSNRYQITQAASNRLQATSGFLAGSPCVKTHPVRFSAFVPPLWDAVFSPQLFGAAMLGCGARSLEATQLVAALPERGGALLVVGQFGLTDFVDVTPQQFL